MHICSEGIINADLASKLGVCLMDLFFRYACIPVAYIIHMLMMLFSNNFAKCWLAWEQPCACYCTCSSIYLKSFVDIFAH